MPAGSVNGLRQEAVHLQPLLDAIEIMMRSAAFTKETVGTNLENVKFCLQAAFDPGAEQGSIPDTWVTDYPETWVTQRSITQHRARPSLACRQFVCKILN